MAHPSASRPHAAKTVRKDYKLPPTCGACAELRARLKDEVVAGRMRDVAVTIVAGAKVMANRLVRS